MKARLLIAVIGLVIATTGAVVFMTLHSSPKPTVQTPISSKSSQKPATTTVNHSVSYPIKIYFSKHPDSDNDPTQVFAVQRTAPTIATGTYAISQLINGTQSEEAKAGYFSQVRVRPGSSTCGSNDFSLTIKNGVATLAFCRPFDALGVISDAQAEQEITTTLKQFSAVQKVVILNPNGNCQFNLSGQDKCK